MRSGILGIMRGRSEKAAGGRQSLSMYDLRRTMYDLLIMCVLGGFI